jgi:pimeloyl-ACP methyl ester carboxylesterase
MQVFETSDGLRLAYSDQGTGPAVLCLAGLTRTHHDFDEMAAAMPGIRLIRMDYRGRGQSDYDPNPMNYSVPIEARDAVELLDHLDLPKAAVIGTSRGGMVALFMAATARDRLTGIVLNDVGPVLDRADLGRIVEYVGLNPSYKSYNEAAQDYPAMCAGFANVPAARWRVEVERLWAQTDTGLVNRYDPALRRSVEAVFNGPEVDLWPLFDAANDLAGAELAFAQP